MEDLLRTEASIGSEARPCSYTEVHLGIVLTSMLWVDLSRHVHALKGRDNRSNPS